MNENALASLHGIVVSLHVVQTICKSECETWVEETMAVPDELVDAVYLLSILRVDVSHELTVLLDVCA